MQFAVWLENHSTVGQRSLEDVIGIIGAQLSALGHHVAWDANRDLMVHNSNGINILVEGFTEGHVEIVRLMHAAGARFLIVATEEPTPKGFNHGTQREMVKRQEVFPRVAKYADGIIHLVPGQHVADWYGQFAPTAYTELGYAPSLMRATAQEPEYDYGFFGSLTPRRYRLLKRLANAAAKPRSIKMMVDFGTQADRDREMRRAKVILQIRKFDEMGLVSSSRCNTSLCIGRPVVAEHHELSKPWDEVIKFAPLGATQKETEDNFIDASLAVCAAWRGVYAAQVANFKAKLPPEACAGAALEKLRLVGGRIAPAFPTPPKAPLGIVARHQRLLGGAQR